MKLFLLALTFGVLVSFTACGGGTTTETKTPPPPPTTFTISASVTGLSSGASVVLQNNGGNNLTVSANQTAAFTTAVTSGAAYSVSILTQPSGESCTLGSNSSGTATANVTVAVTCAMVSSSLSITVTATGITSGTLVLQDDAGQQVTLTSTSGSQAFSNTYTSGATYMVRVVSVPTGSTCAPSNNTTGTITGNVTITVACSSATTTDSISVTATGLTGTLVVQDDKGDTLTLTGAAMQTFATLYPSGSTYSVSVTTQPTGQTCTLSSNATGTITANTTVTATCTTNTVNDTISVAVTGLTGTLVMQDDKADTLTFTTNTTLPFATMYASGSTYAVSVKTQPTGQTCTLSSNASGTITSSITVTATCTASGGGPSLSVDVSGLSGTVIMQDDQGDSLTFTTSGTQKFATTYTSGSTYTVYVTSQPASQSCIPTYSTGTINSNVTISAACATGSTRQLGTVSGVSTVSCAGKVAGGVCQQLTVSCPSVPDVFAFVKTNAPSASSLGTVTYNTGTDGNGLYDTLFSFGDTAVGNVLAAGFTTVQISWGSPFNGTQPAGWVQGTGGVLAAACRYATVTQWIYDNIQNNTSLPLCATANSGGAGALAYALSQYPSGNILSMAEVTSGPPTGRLDWGCGCQAGTMAVQCGSSTTLGTCFGTADSPVWDPAYDPSGATAVCTNAVGGNLPPGGLNFFLGDSVEAPGATYSLPKTNVNLVFGDADNSSAIAIGQDWFNHITSTKGQACVSGGMHSMANTLAGAQQIATDIINLCKVQP